MIAGIPDEYHQVLRVIALPPEIVRSQSDALQEFFRPRLQGDGQNLLRLCDKNIVTLRLAERLQLLGLTLPEAFLRALAQERSRIHKTRAVIARMSSLLTAGGIGFVMTKAFQHGPDMGHDIDLLLADSSQVADELILKEFQAVPERQTRINSVAGKIGYDIPGSSPVEIHHGRMGHFGEHAWYPAAVIARSVAHTVDGAQTREPAADDRLVIQVLQRLYSHGYFRISDVLSAFDLIGQTLNWEHIEKICDQLGAKYALKCFLTYVDGLHVAVHGKQLLPVSVRNRFYIKGLPTLKAANEVLYIPKESVIARAYLSRFGSDLLRLNWRSLGKTCLIPWLALDFFAKRLTQKLRSSNRVQS